MSFKKPFKDLSSQELHQKLRRLIYYFERGEPLTDENLDMYLLLKKRINDLDARQDPDIFKIVELEVNGSSVLGEIIELHRFYIEVENNLRNIASIFSCSSYAFNKQPDIRDFFCVN